MEFNQSVSNPMLVGAMQLMKSDSSKEHQSMFLGEMMRAKFLVPAMITPAPEPDEEGKLKLTAENKVQFPLLVTQDGRKFFMAFTDKVEWVKWPQSQNEGHYYFAASMEECMGMTLHKDSVASGCVINPFGGNVVISREMMSQLLASRASKQLQKAKNAQNAQKDGGQSRPGAGPSVTIGGKKDKEYTS